MIILIMLSNSSAIGGGYQNRYLDKEAEDSKSLPDAFVPNIWNKQFAILERWIAGMRPTVTARALAYINLGAYEAVLPIMNGYRSNVLYLPGLGIPSLPKPADQYDWNLVLNFYYAKADSNFLLGALPEWKRSITALKDSINNLYKIGVTNAVVENSMEWANMVAGAIYDYARTDLVAEKERSNPYPKNYYYGENKIGNWKGEIHGGYEPFTPNWGNVRTFTSFGKDLISAPPPSYSEDTASVYYKMHLEVYNDWLTMDEEKRWRAEFWSDDVVPFTFGPSTRIFVIARQMAERKNFNLATTLHLYCKLGLGLNDAMVACWKNKYLYNTERPWQYITTHIDPSYRSIMGEPVAQAGKNPPFPSYPSGHSSCAGVSELILSEFFGESFPFIDSSHYDRMDFMGAPRKFSNIKEMAEENAYSRIPMGAHVRFDCDEGLRIGRIVGKQINNYLLHPLDKINK